MEGPSHSEEEGRLINISLGYEILPLCMDPTKLCINVSRQARAFVLTPKRNVHTLLGLFTDLPFYENHVNTTKTLKKKKKDKSENIRGLLMKTLNILLFIEINVKLIQGN